MKRKEKTSEHLDWRHPVLDAGYVELCDYMGDDETVVRSARQSYGKDEDDLPPEVIDRQIKEMLKNGHSSPFEQVVFQFHFKTPIFVQRHIIRHRTARVNEISGRYSTFGWNNFYVPNYAALLDRKSYPDNSEETYDVGPSDAERIKKFRDETIGNNISTFGVYSNALESSVPPELARINLPLTLYTEFYWQMDLHNLLHFLELRLDEHAQKETREYALAIYKIVKDICPITAKYFVEYRLNSSRLSQKEVEQAVSLLEHLAPSDLSGEERVFIAKLIKISDRNKIRNKSL
jgi:thymidylate synthase (FAD)